MKQSPILGVDHICLSSRSPEAESSEWAKQGWKSHFTELNLSLQLNKKPFMRRHHPSHDMVFLTAPSGISVEMIRHHPDPSNYGGRYQVEFVSSGCGIEKLQVQCRDLTIASRFWTEGIGFSPTHSPLSMHTYQFRSIMPRWSTKMLLTESKTGIEDGFLDDEGYTCLSLITRGVNLAQEHLLNFGARDFGDPFDVKVGQRHLRLNFFRGPCGELFELIEALI